MGHRRHRGASRPLCAGNWKIAVGPEIEPSGKGFDADANLAESRQSIWLSRIKKNIGAEDHIRVAQQSPIAYAAAEIEIEQIGLSHSYIREYQMACRLPEWQKCVHLPGRIPSVQRQRTCRRTKGRLVRGATTGLHGAIGGLFVGGGGTHVGTNFRGRLQLAHKRDKTRQSHMKFHAGIDILKLCGASTTKIISSYFCPQKDVRDGSRRFY